MAMQLPERRRWITQVHDQAVGLDAEQSAPSALLAYTKAPSGKRSALMGGPMHSMGGSWLSCGHSGRRNIDL